MTTTTKANSPQLFLTTGEAAREHRIRLELTQTEFWKRLGIAQSGGSHFEAGRRLPYPVQLLLHFLYAPDGQALDTLQRLRVKPANAPADSPRNATPAGVVTHPDKDKSSPNISRHAQISAC